MNSREIEGNSIRSVRIQVRPQCGACGSWFNHEDYILAIAETKVLPPHGIRSLNKFGNIRPEPPLISCKTSDLDTEIGTIHTICFRYFQQLYPEKIHQLWRTTTWKYPWHLFKGFSPSPVPDDSSGVEYMKRICPKLNRMPAEVNLIIWKNVKRRPLPRYHLVASLGVTLSQCAAEPMKLIIPLCEVKGWIRGSKPVIGTAGRKPFFRMSMDYLGIQSVEQLERLPTYAGTSRRISQSETHVFAIEETENLYGVIALFQYGLLRIILPELCFQATSPWPYPKLRVWNTPCVPELSIDDSYSPKRWSSFILNTGTCSGLTFFISKWQTFAVHAHTESSPSALETYGRVYQHRPIWVYIPLTQKDPIIGYGLRKNQNKKKSCFLLKFQYSMPLIIGQLHGMETNDTWWSTEPWPILHYYAWNDALKSRPISEIQGYPRSDEPEVTRNRRFGERHPPGMAEACFSYASLRRLAHTETFYRAEDGQCMGIILNYRNGTQRAVGQCRLGLDISVPCANPSMLYYANRWSNDNYIQWAKLHFSSADAEEATQPANMDLNWKLLQLRGCIVFWCFHDNLQIEFYDTREKLWRLPPLVT